MDLVRAYRMPSLAFRVRTSSTEIADRLDLMLDPFRCEGGSTDGSLFEIAPRDGHAGFEVRLDGEIVHRTARAVGAVDFVLWKASTLAIDATRDRVVIHAGAVSWRRDAVLLPAPPDSGKTTLTAGLVRAGFGYLTDEAAVIDPTTLEVHPFPRALWMEPASVRAIARVSGERALPEVDDRPVNVAPVELRSDALGAPAPVRHVIFPRYDARSAHRLERMSRAAAVVELANNGYNVKSFGAHGIGVLARLVEGAECFRLVMNDLVAAIDAVLEVVDTSKTTHRG